MPEDKVWRGHVLDVLDKLRELLSFYKSSEIIAHIGRMAGFHQSRSTRKGCSTMLGPSASMGVESLVSSP